MLGLTVLEIVAVGDVHGDGGRGRSGASVCSHGYLVSLRQARDWWDRGEIDR